MDRKTFLRSSLMGGTALMAMGSKPGPFDQAAQAKTLDPIGFNHLPSQTPRIMANMTFTKPAHAAMPTTVG